MQIERRRLLRGFLGAVALSASGLLVPMAAYAEKIPPKEDEIIKLTREIVVGAKIMGGPISLKKRLTNAWIADDGLPYVVYEDAVVRKSKEAVIETFGILDVMHNGDLDPRLSSGELGVVIPPVSSELSLTDIEYRTARLSINLVRQMEDHLVNCQKLGLLVGRLTSFPEDYGDHVIYRFQNMAFKYRKDNREIIPLPVGDLAFKMGMIPDFAKTITPQLDLEPEFKVAKQEVIIHGGKPVSLEGCQLTGRKFVGMSTYYDAVGKDNVGCQGCRADLKMMNGEIFDPNKYTLAINFDYARLLLNKRALVRSPETGISLIAKITDSGGFSHLSDVSRGVRDALGHDSGRGYFPIEITILDC